MASLPPSPSSLLFLTLALILISISPAFSTSRQALDDDHHDQPVNTGFKITLNHVDSGGSFTKTERLHRSVKRASHRLKHLNERVLTAKHPKLTSSVFPGGGGEYFMTFSLGTPTQSFYGVMDTGSDLIWTQCRPCLECFAQPSPMFDPTKSSSFANLSCSSNLCQDLPSICNANDRCVYLYSYGDGSFTAGYLAAETFTFGKVSVPNVGFGCGVFDFGSGSEFGDGLVGLGGGPLSLISQLGESTFTYCLTSFEGTKPSTLLIGSQPNLKMKTTPLIQNPFIPTFYYLSLEGITIGSTKLPVNKTTFALQPDGLGGVIIDSGTTITFLVENAYILVRKEFKKQIKLPLVDTLNSTGLDLCFKLPSDPSSVKIPALVFHFTGADLAFPKQNYMVTNSSIMCLAMIPSFGFSIFGNIQQQNTLVVYDLHKETISFMPTDCDNF